MRQRATNESKPVGLFPFLAVLLCTMGALLVLLVVLAQRAGERVLSQQTQLPDTSEPLQNDLQEHKVVQANDTEAEALAKQLAEAHAYQEKIRKLRKQANERLQKEQLRLSHIEEHTRRIEHELVQLAMAAKQLEATENNQSVDQQQAESQLVRLRELIDETEEELAQLRKNAVGERSYAIVPYQGPNGTYRRPIYIECSSEGVVIQPEGIRFVGSDFVAPGWPGNPLAAALRASREYLNAKAAQSGAPEPPDPYPLLIVRPDGIAEYLRARAALASWDADFGYEFVESDWKLEYPDLPDPQLAKLQQHAQLNARDDLARLVRSAPSRFRGTGLGGGSSVAAGGTSGSRGYGAGGESGDSKNLGALTQSAGGDSSEGGGSGNDQSFSEAGAATGDFQHGASHGNTNGNTNGDAGGNQDQEANSFADATGTESSTQEGGVGLRESVGGESGQGGSQKPAVGANAASLAQTGGGGSASGSSSGSSSRSSATAGGQPTGSANPTASLNISNQNVKSIAKSRGKNWAISQGARGALPIRRPIHVLVRKDRLTLLPSRHATGGIEATGSVISLNQPNRQVSVEFVEALQTRVEQWGLAGNGLYWRPVLELNIGPEAKGTARGITQLLHNSGVEVSLQKTEMRR